MPFSDSYENPLGHRYSSKEMSYLFSDTYKYTTWRKLWISLAKAEKKVGLPISDEQIKEMEQSLSVFDHEKIAFFEKKFRHEVMAHIHAFGDLCPHAKSILHLGATSSFVIDNTDLIQMKKGLDMIEAKLAIILKTLSKRALELDGLKCLSYTHLQTAQPTTYGKRICLWLQDFYWDLITLKNNKPMVCFLGAKGATGSQDSFLSLLHGDSSKVEKLEKLIAHDMGFEKIYPIASQTYPRKIDQLILSCFASLASSCHKMATDVRLLCHMGEIEEPFENSQVGSSAMPHKRNPILSERLCSLSRYVLSLWNAPTYTSATQWLERSLDDSAIKRIAIPEAFLCIDGMLTILYHIAKDFIVYPSIVTKRLQAELPYLSLEKILMESVKKGKSRQDVHERLRVHAHKVKQEEKLHGHIIDLNNLLASDEKIGLSKEEIMQIYDNGSISGLSKQQVHFFIEKELNPYLDKLHIEKASIPDLSV